MTVPEAADVERAAVDEQALDERAVDEQAVDDQAVDDQAADGQAQARLRRGRLVTATVVGSLVLVVGVVALLGGFRARTDLRTPVAAGTLISTGPYEVTLADATVQHHRSTNEWEVVVSGTARTTGTTSIAPPSGDSGFVFARDAVGGETRSSRSIRLGAADDYSSPSNLTPGLPAVPWTVTFRFPAQLSGTLLVAVFDQEYTTPYLFSDEEGWRATRSARTMTIPLRPLAETEY